MEYSDRLHAFVKLGTFLKQFEPEGEKQENQALNELFYADFYALVQTIKIQNPWYIEPYVRTALGAIAKLLSEDTLRKWLSEYSFSEQQPSPKTVAVIMAGNIPLVGFNDWLCVLLSGNKFYGKLSSDDKFLLPFISNVLIAIEPAFRECIEFTDAPLKKMDAVIATGSNNSARYFDYYFSAVPHIIRKNRNSVAVLNGNESDVELKKLADDLFLYFGLGCRSVSKVFVPTGYSFNRLFDAIYSYQFLIHNNKYANNYEYNRTVYLMKNDKSLLDNNFFLLKEDAAYSSPIGMLFYEYYSDAAELNTRLKQESERLQCIVSSSPEIEQALPFGTTQCPGLSDYADGVDTMRFLEGLNA